MITKAIPAEIQHSFTLQSRYKQLLTTIEYGEYKKAITPNEKFFELLDKDFAKKYRKVKKPESIQRALEILSSLVDRLDQLTEQILEERRDEEIKSIEYRPFAWSDALQIIRKKDRKDIKREYGKLISEIIKHLEDPEIKKLQAYVFLHLAATPMANTEQSLKLLQTWMRKKRL